MTSGTSLYEAVGGEPTFRRLVAKFYEGVISDPPLRALYPEEDLGPAADRLTKFLIQYWGGPSDYHLERGHPRLRMRHAPFPIDSAMRDRWLTHMGAAIDSLELPEPQHDALWSYLSDAASALRNASD